MTPDPLTTPFGFHKGGESQRGGVQAQFKIWLCLTVGDRRSPRYHEAMLDIHLRDIAGRLAPILVLSALLTVPARADTLPDGVSQNLVLAPGGKNPRNSEGDFIHLRDGRILFIYSHFTRDTREESAADLVSRVSSDDGKTWTDRDEPVIAARSHGVATVMSVSLLRLKDDRIALFYIAKKSDIDCRMVMRTSGDEAKTWSAPIDCTSGPGYAIVTNGRVVQLNSGRIIFPVSWHDQPVPPGGV